MGLYRNNLKNREFDKEASQNSHLERATIVRATVASEDENFEKKPTPSKTDSSGRFGIYQKRLKSWNAALALLQIFCSSFVPCIRTMVSCSRKKICAAALPNSNFSTVFVITILLYALCAWVGILGFEKEDAGIWDKRVYLATYPRSGNHWVRYLIEEATHIATSSVYCDGDVGRSHLGKAFPWGGYCPKYGYEGRCRYPTPDDVVVVKTHFPAVPAQEYDRMPYQKTIRIVRHPIDSLYSFYLWGRKGPYLPRIPSDLLKKRINTWKKFHAYWNRQPNVVTVRYEELLSHPQATLKIILEAIGSSVSDEEIERAVAKYPPRGTPMKHIHQFAAEDLELIWQQLGELMSQFDYTIPSI